MSTYLRPDSLEQALGMLAKAAANPPIDTTDRLTVLAGATDFLPAETTRSAWFQPTPRNVLDVGALDALRGIASTDQGYRIGALTTWTDLINAPLPSAFDGLKQASRQVGGVQIQNRGTIGGNLCNASPAADGVPPLMALNASVELTSQRGVRHLPMQEFVLGNRRTALQTDELLTAILVPAQATNARSQFLKLGARRYLVISIASVAINLVCDDSNRIEDISIAVGACSAVPKRLTSLEQKMRGTPLAQAGSKITSADFADLSPLDDVRASAAYRLSAAQTLVQRALQDFNQPTAVAA
ncbi:MAG: FAD binding domain-containing protein [Beijerinckiaceae bacterium]